MSRHPSDPLRPPVTRLAVKVVPGASGDAMAGWLGPALKLRVQAPAEGGRANQAVIRLLAAALDLPPCDLSIDQGVRSARKLVRIDGLEACEVRSRLESRG